MFSTRTNYVIAHFRCSGVLSCCDNGMQMCRIGLKWRSLCLRRVLITRNRKRYSSCVCTLYNRKIPVGAEFFEIIISYVKYSVAFILIAGES